MPLDPTAARMPLRVASTADVTEAASSKLPAVIASNPRAPLKKSGTMDRDNRGSGAARCCGAAKPIVDRAAEAVLWDRHDRDAPDVGTVERAQRREQVGRRLREIAAA